MERRPGPQPPTAAPPPSARTPARISGTGISFAPDIAGRVYAGTDHGVAVSNDSGATWDHFILDPATPVDGDRLQDTALSLLALPGDRALATSRRGVFMKGPGSNTWTRIRTGAFDFARAFKMMDVSPLDSDKVFVLQNYDTLLLFEVASGMWTTLPLPGGVSRGPFVRVSRSAASASAIDIWVGAGVELRRATRTGIAAIRSTAASDWISLWRPAGLHDDSGHLGLDADARPVLYGSDGGVFRPLNAEATMWTNAATAAGGMNSYQITSLAGTTTPSASGSQTSLYFATQDNGLWASSDAGQTWPNADCAEGFHMRVRPAATAGSNITVGYGKIGCAPDVSIFSDAHFANARAVPNDIVGGGTLDYASQAFLIAPGYWARFRTAPGVNPEIFVSTDNGLQWRRRAEMPFGPAGVFQPSIGRQRYRPGRPPRASVFLPAFGPTAVEGVSRIGLIHLSEALASGVRTFAVNELIVLPDEGSLGVRATEFDWQAVFAVDPRDASFIIAPDRNNGVVKITNDGGATWKTDIGLTQLVTEGGQLMMYDDEGHMQVTHIAFDPADSNRILVGTRDAGSFISVDHGASWWKVPSSERALYVTGYFFTKGGWPVYAATYGRGLWKIAPPRLRIPRFDEYCRVPCMFRDPRERIPFEHPDWLKDEVIVFLDGSVNGIILSGNVVREITVTPGTRFVRYPGSRRRGAEVAIIASAEGAGFGELAGPDSAAQKVVGVALRGGKPTAFVFSETELMPLPNEPAPRPATGRAPAVAVAAAPRPYLILSTELPTAGLPVLAKDGLLHVRAIDFAPEQTGARQPRLAIDGMPVDAKTYLDEKGALIVTIKVPDALPYGAHRIEVTQETPRGTLRASATFVKATIDEFGNREQQR